MTPWEVAVPGEERLEDRVHTLLTPLNCPAPGYEERERPSHCDVRLAEAGPAVIAEMFSRSQKRELFEGPEDDPHCTAVLDLTH
ncbi:hypothetical protein [Streptomyces sp. NPDC050416]|uniref:hypothetical protein n=1 Tax=Streptomyces sp. NPDC050416 TaxID=3365611 RepID=UPI0037A3A805